MEIAIVIRPFASLPLRCNLCSSSSWWNLECKVGTFKRSSIVLYWQHTFVIGKFSFFTHAPRRCCDRMRSVPLPATFIINVLLRDYWHCFINFPKIVNVCSRKLRYCLRATWQMFQCNGMTAGFRRRDCRTYMNFRIPWCDAHVS